MAERRVSVGDIELYCSERGRGEPLVLLHGLGSSTRDWELQAEPLSEKYRVISIDSRGHGQSDKPAGPYSMAGFAADIARAIDALDIRPAHVVGVSMGAMIGFELAVRDPLAVRSLVAINAGVTIVPKTAKEHWQVFQRLAVSRIFGMRKMGEIIAGRLFPGPDQAPIRAQFAERWAGNDKAAYLAALRAIIGWSVEDRLGKIRCPVLVISGDRDYYPIEDKKKYVAKIPNASLVVVENSGHATPADQPEELTRLIVEFLDRQVVIEDTASGAA
jgi:3-oxoadipate enol-lactonase